MYDWCTSTCHTLITGVCYIFDWFVLYIRLVPRRLLYTYMISLSTGDGDLGAVPRVTLVATQAPHGRVSNSSRDDYIECPCGSAVHVIPEV